MDYIRQFAEAGIKLRGQIVLCRGVNDREELDRTMHDLTQYYPSLESVSIVPAGLTAYRDNLYPLEPFTRKECLHIIDQVTSFGKQCLKKFGTRLFFCADELYVKAGRPIPAYPYWEDFTQIENGVGMMASMAHELEMALDYLGIEERTARRSVSIATGDAAYAYICGLVGMISETCPHLECDVYRVKNNFFGGQVTVSGLLTGKDLAEQLKDNPQLRDCRMILCDGVVNTGKTILELAEMHRNYHPIIATNVISEKYNSNSMIPVYASRISKNSYTGAKQKTISNGKGPDTSDRLFKLL